MSTLDINRLHEATPGVDWSYETKTELQSETWHGRLHGVLFTVTRNYYVGNMPCATQGAGYYWSARFEYNGLTYGPETRSFSTSLVYLDDYENLERDPDTGMNLARRLVKTFLDGRESILEHLRVTLGSCKTESESAAVMASTRKTFGL